MRYFFLILQTEGIKYFY